MVKNKVPNELIKDYSPLVFSVCRKFIKQFPGEEIDDLTQSCWETIIKNYHKYDRNKSKLSTWIVTVCRNTLYNMLRSQETDKRAVHKNKISFEEFMKDTGWYL